jgi:molecular chaperone DnaK
MPNLIVPVLLDIKDGPKHLDITLNKASIDNLISDLLDKVIVCAKTSLQKAKIDTVDGIILVGGTCRVPLLQDKLTKAFNVELIHKADLDTAVSEGAAIQANILAGNGNDNDVVLLDVTPISFGIVANGNLNAKIIEANTTIPTKKPRQRKLVTSWTLNSTTKTLVQLSRTALSFVTNCQPGLSTSQTLPTCQQLVRG